jgi:hypothetical protein
MKPPIDGTAAGVRRGWAATKVAGPPSAVAILWAFGAPVGDTRSTLAVVVAEFGKTMCEKKFEPDFPAAVSPVPRVPTPRTGSLSAAATRLFGVAIAANATGVAGELVM